ncbi:hypothetical protein YC2023_080011 [Brassica napus]
MISTTQTISKSDFFVATHPRMANSFIILAELKNRDQSLQVLEDQRIDLLVLTGSSAQEDDRLRVCDQ